MGQAFSDDPAGIPVVRSPHLPPFALVGARSKYDLSTYVGRVRHIADKMDLRYNFVTKAQLASSEELIARFVHDRLKPGTTDEMLWAARTQIEVVYPAKGSADPIHPLFRMCAFMPVNLPVSAGMLLAGPGRAQLFFQWLNQSYNAGFNYAHRNMSVPVDVAGMAASYGVATTTAMGMAWGLGRVVTRLQASVAGGSGPAAPMPLGVKLLSRGLPWLAVASAGAANVLAMRYREGLDGIEVMDADGRVVFGEDGRIVGRSPAAGRACLAQVALTRVVLPIPILLLPPFLMDAARASRSLGPLMARSLAARTGVELGIIAVFLQCALPLAVGMFPEIGTISAAALEPRFRGLKDLDGRPVETFTYIKGI